MIKYINKILISIFLLCSSFTSILANYNETNTQYSNTQAYSNYKENALDNLDWGNKIIGIFDVCSSTFNSAISFLTYCIE